LSILYIILKCYMAVEIVYSRIAKGAKIRYILKE